MRELVPLDNAVDTKVAEAIESGAVSGSFNLWPPIITQRREEMGSLNHNADDFLQGYTADVAENVPDYFNSPRPTNTPVPDEYICAGDGVCRPDSARSSRSDAHRRRQTRCCGSRPEAAEGMRD